ncbi:MAG TPA: Hpt domain-containing protein [Myxococcales bacterium]
MSEADDLDRELREHYVSVGQAKVDGLSAALGAARRRPADPDSVERLRVLVHKIAGSAGSYGFDALGAAAKGLEKKILAAPSALPSDVLAAADLFLAEMTAQFAAARGSDPG